MLEQKIDDLLKDKDLIVKEYKQNEGVRKSQIHYID
jgi:hypothetical protein